MFVTLFLCYCLVFNVYALQSYIDPKVHRPIVILHGLLDTSSTLNKLQIALEEYFPGVYVHNVVVGDNEKNFSLLTNIKNQAKEVFKIIQNDKKLMEIGECDIIGHSQGNIIFRTIIEELLPKQNKIKFINFISLAGPLNGVFCGKEKSKCEGLGIPDEYDEYVYENAYNDVVQSLIAPANYWKSPYSEQYQEYMNSLAVLPDLDNLRNYSEHRKIGFTSLHKMYCLFSKNDGVVMPYQSSIWGYFSEDSDDVENVVNMKDLEIYVKDTFGLRTLDERGDLIFIEFTGNHYEFVRESGIRFLKANLFPLLD